MGICALPDMYALSPRAPGIHIRQSTRVHVITYACIIQQKLPYTKNIGVELNLANWRIKIKSPIFYLANVFCTRLTQNVARNPSAVAVI